MSQIERSELQQVAEELAKLCLGMLELEGSTITDGLKLDDTHAKSARNLAHYLALRQHDIRDIQRRLAALGLSSLGRAEGHVMSALRAVLAILNKLGTTEPGGLASASPTVEFGEDREILERNTEVLLGSAPEGRRVRIMVTMSTDAATDYDSVRDLLVSGMDCMRINCAHDDEDVWIGMIRNLQRAREETGRPCRILMDLAGPKLRTGSITPGPAVLKIRPKRDEFGRVSDPARLWLVRTEDQHAAALLEDPCVPIAGSSVERLHRGDTISFRDSRGSQRTLKVAAVKKDRCLATLAQTAYFVPGLELQVKPGTTKSKSRVFAMRVGELPSRSQTLLLRPGDKLVLSRSNAIGRPAKYDQRKRLVSPARIGVNLPEFFEHAREGEPIWFDDGKIGGVIRSVDEKSVHVEITQARPEGEKLGPKRASVCRRQNFPSARSLRGTSRHSNSSCSMPT